MDDQHGRIQLNLAYHQLPPCPCVVHTIVEITVIIIIIIIIIITLQVVIFQWLMSFLGDILGWLGI